MLIPKSPKCMVKSCTDSSNLTISARSVHKSFEKSEGRFVSAMPDTEKTAVNHYIHNHVVAYETHHVASAKVMFLVVFFFCYFV